MFCSKCGAEIESGAKFCLNCGTKVSGSTFDGIVNSVSDAINSVDFDGVASSVNGAINGAEKEFENAMDDVKESFNGNKPSGNGNQKLQTDRSLVTYILLSIITCGIYGYYFIYKMAHDVNIACEGDGEQTGGLVAYIIFSILTCGIYSWIWLYRLGNRLSVNAPKYGLEFQENGTTVIMWCIFGALICGIGPWIAMHILIKNTNSICEAYNRKYGF